MLRLSEADAECYIVRRFGNDMERISKIDNTIGQSLIILTSLSSEQNIFDWPC